MNFLEKGLYNIAFNGVLNDLQKWADEKDKEMFGKKVLRVFGKCLRQKHFELAARICKKYNYCFISAPKSDIAMAFSMAITAQNKLKYPLLPSDCYPITIEGDKK